ncbi:hypothetical protein [Vibrio campbellii]|uniref:hypothetical protein n=1 Tax=Vibrio campbellii TaxID=680 RepID=UPI003F82F300
MFSSNMSKPYFSWCLLLSCFGFASSAQAELTIQEAVDLWILDGAEFRQMVQCSPQAQLNNGVQKIYYDSSSCVLSELATYALAKECFGDAKAQRVNILDAADKSKVMSFDINVASCSLLEKKSVQKKSKPAPPPKSSQPSTSNSKAYVVQLYSGAKPPNKVFAQCATTPLYEHYIHGSYYLFSDVYFHYSEAKQLMEHLHSECPDLSMWIRPIKR